MSPSTTVAASGVLDPRQWRDAAPSAFRKLNPLSLWRNPVMFIVELGAAFTTVLAVADPSVFAWVITVWLWLTVGFAALAEAIAEGRGKAQAAGLRRTRTETTAHRLTTDAAGFTGPDGAPVEEVPATALRNGDLVLVEAGQVIPADGDVVIGIASVDESAITGESAPVIRESGGDRSAVTGGTRVLSDWVVVEVTAESGKGFMDRMIALVEGASRQRTPNEIALNILLAAMTIVFLLAVVTIQPAAIYAKAASPALDNGVLDAGGVTGIVLVSLLVCLIPTTIGALLSAIGIAGMDRLVQRNVLAMSGRAVEAAGDVDTLLLDKTGTVTHGNRRASAFLPLPGVAGRELAEAALSASLADETPEGRSIVDFAREAYGVVPPESSGVTPVPFTAQSRMSGVDVVSPDGVTTGVRKGAAAAMTAWTAAGGGDVDPRVPELVGRISDEGGTPLLVAVCTGDEPARVLGVVHLKDVVKDGMTERFDTLRAMGIRTVMVTGDNPRTAAAIAAEAGVDDFIAEATPEDKLELIRAEQRRGRLVAMTGDGTNDAPALAQADVGLAMNTGTSAAKEAGNMVDLDSDPTKLIEIVAIGKQLLMTRGALTTFSIANDIAKYFAIIPAIFAVVHPGLDALNIMRLSSPESAIISAVVFNALIIIALVPLALRGVRYRPATAVSMLRRNLFVYGLGGVVAPFLGIKAIDLLVSLIPGITS
ncbi:K+-transporting ATPase ATPase B chain [Stackebrandtia albiflava]|uniref:Potassium-transporting ATPase ATP-binding subunit n=1 Tax=Stackebrandtia albiflava TaxID=406432 RepID=A0A562VAZ1_9ACTN|nr:potassium-transporting ATPase subunit KdpB [Stackebrandtia albiflava]TWJ15035.1 K+-transporting ATPase ATPase B chain [Stackebrandtia albiflava]